ICPSAGSEAEPDNFGGMGASATTRSNFTSLNGLGKPGQPPSNLSYSMNAPFPHIPALQKGWSWEVGMDSTYVLAADINPGAADVDPSTVKHDSTADQQALMNSRNHRGFRSVKAGQNVC